MSEIKHKTKFSPSSDLCLSCTRLLRSELKDPVLLHSSIFFLRRSSNTCSLCYLIWRGLTGFLTVKNGPRSTCNLQNLLTTEPGQSSQVWGRRNMADYTSFATSLAHIHHGAEDWPISFLEVILFKTSLSGPLETGLALPRAPSSGKLKNAFWGLNCDLGVICEAEGCPYIWEYRHELRRISRNDYFERFTEKESPFCWQNTPIELFSGTKPRDVWWGEGIAGPYHRTVLEVSAVDHRSGEDVIWARPGTGDQRDRGVSGILQRLKQEESPTVCGSPARLELTQHWLKECLTWHWECLYWRESFSMPSRVIDVGPKDGSREPFLYMPPPSHQDYYLCLSHRWGGAKVLQTVMGDPPGTPNGKTGTFSEFQSAIPMASMPKTFRDAVQVTRALGFRYIWIDSLCIIQDRPSDWEAEAKKMGSYYRNAHLTLLAGSAVSADSGLFFPIASPARPSNIGSVSLEVPNCRHHGAEPHTFPLFAREPRMMRNQYGDGPKPKCALDERAWVLQEELLSARALTFTDEGLYWECTSLTASEWHPHGSQYLYTRALSGKKPKSYGGEVFRTPHSTCAQQFKAGLVIDREYLDSTPDPLVRALRSRVPVALDELLSELDALGRARVRMPPRSSDSNSTRMQMVKHRQTQSATHEQNLQSDEEHLKHICSTSRPLSPQPDEASAFRRDNIVSLPFFWHRLVADYSARHMTRESDRLIAIQGVVSMLSAVRNDRYYAGLWGRTLHEDMLWMVSDTKIDIDQMCDCMPQKIQQTQGLKPRRRSDKSDTSQEVAPSWSWISADQGVVFLMIMDLFEVHQEFFRPLRIVMDDDTAVFNVRGRLTIEGVLRPVGLAVAFDELHPWREIEGTIYDPSDPSKKKIGFWQPDRRTSMTGAVVCVPLVLMGKMKLVINCLVLEPTENCRLRNKASKLLEFRRIGMATIGAEHRAFLGLGKSERTGDSRSWNDRVKEWTRKPVVIDIV